MENLIGGDKLCGHTVVHKNKDPGSLCNIVVIVAVDGGNVSALFHRLRE
jgi:hypothetical protein